MSKDIIEKDLIEEIEFNLARFNKTRELESSSGEVALADNISKIQYRIVRLEQATYKLDVYEGMDTYVFEGSIVKILKKLKRVFLEDEE